MVSRFQKGLVKRGQREAGLDDAEYRDALETVSGCRSTTDLKMTDRHVDLALAYMEAIYWRKVDAGALQPPCRPDAVFRERHYWARKNTQQETSRDRYTASHLSRQIGELERGLADLGFGAEYCAAIRGRVTHGRQGQEASRLYAAALQRTLRAKRNGFADHTSANRTEG